MRHRSASGDPNPCCAVVNPSLIPMTTASPASGVRARGAWILSQSQYPSISPCDGNVTRAAAVMNAPPSGSLAATDRVSVSGPVDGAERYQRRALRLGDAGQIGDVRALIRTVVPQGEQWPAVADLPQSHGAVKAPARHDRTVLAHGHPVHRVRVPLQCP